MLILTLVILLICTACVSPADTQELSEPEENFEALWQTFDRNYGIFTAKKVDWDALYQIYRPQVTPETADNELFDIMSNLLGHLNDNHVRLRAGEKLYRSGILGEMEMEDFSLDLIKEKYLKGKFETRVRDIFTYGWVDDDIGYFHFKGFGRYDQSRETIDTIIDAFKDAKGVIVDVRQNGGGDDRVGKLIADRFADRKRHYMTTYERNGPEHDDFGPPRYWYTEPDGPRQFKKTVVLLTHRFSISAAENFALAMRVIPHVTVLGDATSGVFADVYGDQLPNGWQFSVPYTLFVDYTGFCWEGIGVPADIRQTNTKADIEQGLDRVLELAMDLIHTNALKPQEESSSTANLKEPLVEPLGRDIEERGIDAAVKAFHEAKAADPDAYFVDERNLLLLGEELSKKGKSKEALAVFELGVEEFPLSLRGLELLAEAHFDQGDTEKGLDLYRKSLEVNRRSYPWEKEAYEIAQEVVAGKQRLTGALQRATLDGTEMQAIEAYRENPDGYYVHEGQMNAVGYQLLGQGKVSEAIEVFTINTEVFPDSWNVWDSLGEAYMVQGEKDLAIESYEKSLELNPGNDNGREMLKKLKEG